MISSKQRTIALSAVAIAAVMVLVIAGPILADMIQAHQAQAFRGWHGPNPQPNPNAINHACSRANHATPLPCPV
jgi:hypothetical protein